MKPSSALSKALRILGSTLICAGVLLMGYAAWMNWGTDIGVPQKMTSAVQAFQETSPSSPSTQPESSDIRTDAPPSPRDKKVGEAIGVLHVPSWGMEIPVIEGSTPYILDQGNAGHYEGTAGAGEVGNFALAGHRRTYGHNFRHLDMIGAGDVVVMETEDAWLIYEWRSSDVVDPKDVAVIYPVPNEPIGTTPTERLLTMTTCWPEYGNSERLVAHFVLDHWVPKSAGTPTEIQ